jgi:hypothetical protein
MPEKKDELRRQYPANLIASGIRGEYAKRKGRDASAPTAPGDGQGERFAAPQEHVVRAIVVVRGQRVMMDSDLAVLYGVESKVLLQAVRRNMDRFPPDFVFQLEKEEVARLRSQFVTSKGRGGRRYAPYAFTEQGVAMLSSVLRSKRAVLVNVEIMRAFVSLRAMLAGNSALARKLSILERKYDSQFKIVFDAIRELMAPKAHVTRAPIGFVRHENE